MKDVKELEKWYKEEIEKRDKIIEKLKEENTLLLKTALRGELRKGDWEKKMSAAKK